MKHRTAFALCLSVIVLTGLVVVSLTLMFIERQDSRLLQQHISTLKKENAVLKSRLDVYQNNSPAVP
ncbi:MAG: hypothetical protein ABFS22_08350 [Pseudomonadota bacterium]